MNDGQLTKSVDYDAVIDTGYCFQGKNGIHYYNEEQDSFVITDSQIVKKADLSNLNRSCLGLTFD